MTRASHFRLSVAAALLLMAGCATMPSARMDAALRAGDPRGALQVVEDGRSDYGSKSQLLYLMDQAMLQHYAGDLSASAQTVDEAAKMVDELYTTSLSEQALGFLSNDMATRYAGEHFEHVLLHVLGLLDYALLGRRDDALIEARRVDDKLKQYALAVGPDKVAYKEDAFARYLAGVLYEGGSRQDLDDAYLSYKQADAAFDAHQKAYATPKPVQLKADLQRLAAKLGERSELEAFKQRDGDLSGFSPAPGAAELVVLLYDGLAPVKVSRQMNLPLFLNDGTQQYFTLALPHFIVQARPVPAASLVVAGQEAPLELFADINAIAVRDLKERMGRVIVKESARAVVKFQAARALQAKAREQGEGAALLAGLATNIYGLVSSQADVRSWRSLPGRIWLARLWLPAGKCHPRLLIDQGGQRRSLDLGELTLAAKERRFLVQSDF